MGRGQLILIASIALAAGASSAMAAQAARIERGRALFDSARPACMGCHTETAHSLDNYGATGKAEEVKAWLRTPSAMLGKAGKKGVMPAYGLDKISDTELDDLAAYLLSLRE